MAVNRLSPTPDFNPRSPRGERLTAGVPAAQREPFQSTLPARGATNRWGSRRPERAISIHAPREGSDEELEDDLFDTNISIHAPREWSDLFPP